MKSHEHRSIQRDDLRAQASDGVDALDPRALLDAIPAAIYATDAAGRVIYFNPAAVELAGTNVAEATGCQHLDPILRDIQRGVDFTVALAESKPLSQWDPERRQAFVDDVARRNVLSVVRRIVEDSGTIAELIASRRIAICGVLYDVTTGRMDFMTDEAIGLE